MKIYVKGEYQSALQKKIHYLKCENKVDKCNVLSYCESLEYM